MDLKFLRPRGLSQLYSLSSVELILTGFTALSAARKIVTLLVRATPTKHCRPNCLRMRACDTRTSYHVINHASLYLRQSRATELLYTSYWSCVTLSATSRMDVIHRYFTVSRRGLSHEIKVRGGSLWKPTPSHTPYSINLLQQPLH